MCTKNLPNFMNTKVYVYIINLWKGGGERIEYTVVIQVLVQATTKFEPLQLKKKYVYPMLTSR